VQQTDFASQSRKKRLQSHELPEYALIIAALAVVGCIAYQGLEHGIIAIVTNVTATLKGA
jgi:hypothetical protein